MDRSIRVNRRQLCAAGVIAALPAQALARTASPAPRTAAALAALIDPSGSGSFVAGAPDTVVTGVLVTAAPGIAAIREAIARRCNLIVSPESPYYGRPAPAPTDPASPMAAMTARTVDALAADVVMIEKHRLIDSNAIAVYRLPDRATPGFSAVTDALAAQFGWRRTGDAPIYEAPGTSLRSVLGTAKAKLGADGGLRYIGDPAMPLRRIVVVPGTTEVVSAITHLRSADALLTGDLREWEVVEYLFDSRNAGHPKALIAVGRILSQQPYAESCAAELRTAAPGLRVELLPVRDPFWRIQA